MSDLFDLGREDSDLVGLHVRIPPNPASSRHVRERLLAYAQHRGVAAAVLADFMFAVGEAVANAIEHSHSMTSIEVRCSVDDEKIVAVVTDTGRGFEYGGRAAPPLGLIERGRGLSIMQGFTDIFSLQSTLGEGTAVLLGRYLRRQSKESPKAS
ncbi:MAG TPA: ATP-binding protein [Verrucomicrobiae bacterium]|jgi:anti-sigma regulatory factor (Ser/Thr protein kinase)|nr:ATP-binding protein [Verrucomicrobiae bacterium]